MTDYDSWRAAGPWDDDEDEEQRQIDDEARLERDEDAADERLWPLTEEVL